MKIKRSLSIILGLSILMQPISTTVVLANQTKEITKICEKDNESNSLKYYEVNEIADYLDRYFSAIIEIDDNNIKGEYDQYLVFKKYGIDISATLDGTYYLDRSGKDCAWAVTKALGKIGLIVAGTYAIGQFKQIADALGSIREAAYVVALAVKDGNLKSYLNGLVPSSKIDIIIEIVLGIAGNITGISEVKKQCF